MPWKQCEFIHQTGRQCGAPAMRGTSFCHHHRRRQLKPAAIHIPSLTDPRGVQTALTQVLRGLLTNRLTNDEAGKILYGIQMAIVEEGKKPLHAADHRKKRT